MKAYLIDFENVKSKGLTGIEQLSNDDKVIIFYSENSDTISFEMHRKVMTSSADIEYLKVRVGGKNALDFQLSTLLGYLIAKELYTHILIISGDKGFDKLHDFWNVSFADRNSCVVFRTQTITQAVSFAASSRGRIPMPIQAEPDIQSEIEEAAATEIVQEISPVTVTEADTAAAEDTPVPTAENAAVQEPAPALPDITSMNINVTKTSSRRRGRKPQSPEVMIRSALLGFVELTDSEISSVVACAVESEDKEDFHNALAKIFKNQATELYKVLRPKYLRIREAIAAEQAENAEPVDQAEKPEELAADNAPVSEEQPTEQTAETDNSGQAEAAPEVRPEPAKEEAPKQKKKPARKRAAKSKPSAVFKAIEGLLGQECTAEEIATVCRLFEETDTKQKLYLSIVKEYRKDRGCEIYKLIKSDYAELEKLKAPQGV